MLGKCEVCSNLLKTGEKFCSRLCYHISTRGKYNSGHENTKNFRFKKGKSGYHHKSREVQCKECKNSFISTGALALFCSDKCKEKSRPDRLKKDFVCKFCEKAFKRRAFNNACYFCSRECNGFFQMAYSGKGYFYKAFALKDHRCEICGENDYQVLVVHHLDRNRKNNDIGNLQILCANCHHRIHFGQGKERKIKIEKIALNKDKFNAFKERFFKVNNKFEHKRNGG